jgi:magnesium transporter
MFQHVVLPFATGRIFVSADEERMIAVPRPILAEHDTEFHAAMPMMNILADTRQTRNDGRLTGDETMIRIIARLADGTVRTEVPPTELAALRSDPAVMLWLDLMPTNGEEQAAERMLLEQFGFHPLAVDDALRESHVPKVDDWKDYIYIVLHAVRFEPSTRRLHTLELDAFVGKNYLVTHHTEKINSLESVWAATSQQPRRLAEGTDNLLYQLVDSLVAEYMPLVDQLDDWIDEVETEILRKPTSHTLHRVIRQKRRMVAMRRSLSALREVLNRLARDDYAVIDPRDRVYFRDVYDHVVRLYEIVESMRDLVNGSMDTYLSVTSNRINEIMKTLTIVNVIFLPISFLAGFWGMNFFATPFAVETGWSTRPLFWLTLTAMIVLPLSMYAWVKLRRWL